MGLGNYLSEDTLFDKETGRIVSDGTWVICSFLLFDKIISSLAVLSQIPTVPNSMTSGEM